MGKRKKEKAALPAGESANLGHNPFASLSGLSAPSRPEPAPAEESDSSTTTAKTSPFPNKLVLRREKTGRRGKTVTRISGLPADNLPELAKTLKKALGCGATVEGADLILLGSLVDRAAEWFSARGAAKVVRGN